MAKPRLLLIHGSFHGPWCWDRVAPALDAAGYSLAAPDLMASAEWPTLDDYVREVERVIDRQPGPVVLVGHSMGGIVTSQVSERCADRVLAAIYVAGLLLRDGESLMSFLEAHRELGVDDLVLENMQVDPSARVASFPREMAPGVFYNECSPEDAAWASERLRPQPLAVYGDTLHLTRANYGRVPRFYLAATHDRAVSPAYQRIMTTRTPCEVAWLSSDHSPFLSQPAEFTTALLRILARLLLPGSGSIPGRDESWP